LQQAARSHSHRLRLDSVFGHSWPLILAVFAHSDAVRDIARLMGEFASATARQILHHKNERCRIPLAQVGNASGQVLVLQHAVTLREMEGIGIEYLAERERKARTPKKTEA